MSLSTNFHQRFTEPEPQAEPVRIYQLNGRPLADPGDPRRKGARALVLLGVLAFLAGPVVAIVMLSSVDPRNDPLSDGGGPDACVSLWFLALLLWSGAYSTFHQRKNDETDGRYGRYVGIGAKIFFSGYLAYRVGTAVAGKIYHDITD